MTQTISLTEKSHVSFIMCGWFTHFAIWGFFSIIRKQPFTSGCWGCRCLIEWYQMCPQYTPLYIIFVVRIYFTLYLTNLFYITPRFFFPFFPFFTSPVCSLAGVATVPAAMRCWTRCRIIHWILKATGNGFKSAWITWWNCFYKLRAIKSGELLMSIACMCIYNYIYMCVCVCMLCPRWRIIPPTTPGI